MEDAATRDDTKYALGSVLNHVLMHQTVIGLEAQKQMKAAGDYPDTVIGCAGGGSNSTSQPSGRVIGPVGRRLAVGLEGCRRMLSSAPSAVTASIRLRQAKTATTASLACTNEQRWQTACSTFAASPAQAHWLYLRLDGRRFEPPSTVYRLIP